eukprot:TRINITY_DN66947_c6_g3_i2.p1 TRINITY_DN66947_c6_g3~~TRINITY_DN66947_c6_g3_i2.p1  ORF type:complete len:469 (+),score=224.23 TRINITY_DN66947_c6_g3_i2:458-1864(+)
MLSEVAQWRRRENIATLLNRRPQKQELLRKLVPHSHHGVDRQGRPVLYEKSGKVSMSLLLSLVSEEEYLEYHTWDMEYVVRRCKRSSERLGRHIDQFTMVIDLTGVDVTHRIGQSLLGKCSASDHAHYPERLGRLIVINPPWIFPTMYKLASPFIDRKTKHKITVVHGDCRSELLKYIDASQLPYEYGGDCRCHRVRGQLPHLYGCVPEFDLRQYTDPQSLPSSPPDQYPGRPSSAPPLDDDDDSDDNDDDHPHDNDDLVVRSRSSSSASEDNNNEDDDALKTAMIPAGDKFVVLLPLHSAYGGRVTWDWSTESKDIAFTIDYFPVEEHQLRRFMKEYQAHVLEHGLSTEKQAMKAFGGSMSSAVRPLVPGLRHSFHLSEPTADSLISAQQRIRVEHHRGDAAIPAVHCPCMVRVTWDNSFSYFTSKTINYRCALVSLGADQPINGDKLPQQPARQVDDAGFAPINSQ